ncbi:hypothetical protein [Flavobacterium sp. KMS]|uniref:toxin-antitoxin system YwqK family antitoxin n=1 Tax=Flavobacterium sp. KMS TaxID=1566023 RepID=UPI000A9D1787|nr:hypothetical protein [Flavobacterium sp. KMS]
MKTTPSLLILLLFIAFALVSFSDPYTLKRISNKDFRYEFYTVDKKIKPKKNKTYYWFKGGQIHGAQGGIAGDMLNDRFIKMFHNNQLAEQGKFKNGLRVGIWKTWYSNGVLATTQSWSNGLRSGKYFRYNETGNLVESGNYSSNLKSKKWIDFEKKDTLIYKKGIVVVKQEKLTKSENFKRKEEYNQNKESQKELKKAAYSNDLSKLATYKAIAKEKQNAKKEQKEKEKIAQKEDQANSNKPKEDSKLITFFKKIFAKKPKQ